MGVVLDDTLSFNDHVDYVRMKVSKILRMFSRQRQGNSDKTERLQRRAARIIYFKAVSKLSADQIMTKLGLEPLYYRRRTHILRFFNECIANRVPRHLFNHFNVRNRDIHRHRKKKLT